MANFKQRPGSSGTWTAAESLLTITLGQTAELILEGGTPPGGERPVLSYSSTIPVKGGESTIGVGPNERLVKLTPQQTGELVVYAKVGAAPGRDLVTPARVVVLPTKESSIGNEHVIVWASAKDGETIQEAYQKLNGSAPDATVYGVKSVNDFVSLLAKYRDAGRRINSLEFNTHGAAGWVSLGADGLNVATIRSLRGRAFHTVFAPVAAVFFHGCNVAEGTAGNDFLVEFGQTFLCGGGGFVAGSTSLGIGTGNWGNGKVYHLWGKTKRVLIAAGGGIKEKENFD